MNDEVEFIVKTSPPRLCSHVRSSPAEHLTIPSVVCLSTLSTPVSKRPYNWRPPSERQLDGPDSPGTPSTTASTRLQVLSITPCPRTIPTVAKRQAPAGERDGAVTGFL